MLRFTCSIHWTLRSLVLICLPLSATLALTSCGGGGGGGGSTGTPPNSPPEPALGNGSHIVLSRATAGGGQDLWVAPINGGDEFQITNHTNETIANVVRVGASVAYLQFDPNSNEVQVNAFTMPSGAVRSLSDATLDAVELVPFSVSGNAFYVRSDVTASNLFRIAGSAGSSTAAVQVTNKAAGVIEASSFREHPSGGIAYEYDNGTTLTVEYLAAGATSPTTLSRPTAVGTSIFEMRGNQIDMLEFDAQGNRRIVSVNPTQTPLQHIVYDAGNADANSIETRFVGDEVYFIDRNTANSQDNLFRMSASGGAATVITTFSSEETLMLAPLEAFENSGAFLDLVFTVSVEDDPATAGVDEAEAHVYSVSNGAAFAVQLSGTVDPVNAINFASQDISLRGHSDDWVFYTRQASPGQILATQIGQASSDVVVNDHPNMPNELEYLGVNGFYLLTTGIREDGFSNEFINIYSYRPLGGGTANVARLTNAIVDEAGAPFELLDANFAGSGQIVFKRGGDYFRVEPGIEVGTNDLNGVRVANNNAAVVSTIGAINNGLIFYRNDNSENIFYVDPLGDEGRVQISILQPGQTLATNLGSVVYAVNGNHVVYGVQQAGRRRIQSSGIGYTSPNPQDVTNPTGIEDVFELLF